MSTESRPDLFELLEDMVDEIELEQVAVDLTHLAALVEHKVSGGARRGPRRRNRKDVPS